MDLAENTNSIWSPLFTAEEDVEFCNKIAMAAESLLFDLRDGNPDGIYDAGLSMGQAGTTLTFLEAIRLQSKVQLVDKAREGVSKAIENLQHRPMTVSLFAGIAGVGWMLDRASEILPEISSSADELNCQIDDTLRSFVLSSKDPLSYELIRGVGGILFYALSRAQRNDHELILIPCLNAILNLAEISESGITWRTRKEHLAPKLYRGFGVPGHSGYDLGLAHGIAGIISLLAMCCRFVKDRDQIENTLAKSVGWLETTKRLKNTGSRYPYFLHDERSARIAWCYGDLSVAIALAHAGRTLRDPRLLSDAAELALHTSEYSDSEKIDEVGLCHGYAGIAHIFHRLFRVTGNRRLKDKCREWISLTLNHLDWTRNGASVWTPNMFTRELQIDKSILTGSAGVALSLLSTISPAKPTWDQLLLLDI